MAHSVTLMENNKMMFAILHEVALETKLFSCWHLKGLCHKMNISFKAYNNKKVLYVHALMVFFLHFYVS